MTVIDFLVAGLGVVLIWVLFPHAMGNGWVMLATLVGCIGIGVACFHLSDGDAIHLTRSAVDDFPRLLARGVCCVGVLGLVDRSFTVAPAALLLLDLVVLTILGRAAVRCIWRRKSEPERLLLVGSQLLHTRLARKIELEETLHAQIVGQVDLGMADGTDLGPGGLRQAVEGAIAAVDAAVIDSEPERIVVSSDGVSGDHLRSILAAARRSGLKVSFLPTAYGGVGLAARLGRVAELPMLEFTSRYMGPGAAAAKRAFDFAVSALLLLLLLPVFAVIALAIRLDDRGRVFFLQERGGKGGRPFEMLKFRTMTSDAEERLSHMVELGALSDPMYKFAADPRVTRVGAFLRRTSLDELPQLVNVLKGDMSLVGPRPEDLRLVRRYDNEALSIRCGMKPGLTGPMQVHGRGRLSFVERLDLEREYMENHSFARDLRILFMTVPAMFSRNGAF